MQASISFLEVNSILEFLISFYSDDIEDLERLKLRLGVPENPPNHSRISRDVLILQNKVAARYVAVPSFISLEAPQEEYKTQDSLLRDIRRGYQVVVDTVHMLCVDPQDMGHQRSRNYVDYGTSSSGEYFWLIFSSYDCVFTIRHDIIGYLDQRYTCKKWGAVSNGIE